MLKSRAVVAFVATTTPDRAKRFYAKTRGLRLTSEDAFGVVFDAGGTVLRVATVHELHPAGYTVLGWIVPDVRRAAGGLVHRGVVFRRYDGLDQDAQGIWTTQSGDKIAWFEDPDGNTLSLTEPVKRGRSRGRPARSRKSA